MNLKSPIKLNDVLKSLRKRELEGLEVVVEEDMKVLKLIIHKSLLLSIGND